MKTQKIFSTVLLTAIMFLFASTEIYAQRGARADRRPEGRQEMRLQARSMDYCSNIPDLTEEQTEAIQQLRTERLKKSTEHRDKMDVLRARKKALLRSDNPDMGEVDKIIDEMSELRNQQLKYSARHRQQVRELLTDEQKVYFDAHSPKNKRRMDSRRGHSRRR
ncbi:MAG: Spy/CpxP family protein refolding chaperone [Bacteroidales bacterium]